MYISTHMLTVIYQHTDDTMDVDATTAVASKKKKTGNGFRLERNEKQKQHKAARVVKSSRHRRARNEIVFVKSARGKNKGTK